MRANERYTFKEGSRLARGKATLAGRELKKLSVKHGGLTAEGVLSAAKAASHPLHEFFEWSNSKAAYAFRLVQARHLIHSIVVKYDTPEDAAPVRAYVAFAARGADDEYGVGSNARYLSTHVVMSDAELRARLLGDALRDYTLWESRYRHLQELEAIFVTAKAVLKRAAKKPVVKKPAKKAAKRPRRPKK